MNTSRTGQRIAITGAALNTNFGFDVSRVLEALSSTESGFRPISNYKTTGCRVTMAGECPAVDTAALPDRKMQKVLRRKDLIAVTTATRAIINSNLITRTSEATATESNPNWVDPRRFGAFFGVGCTHIGDLVPYFEAVKASAVAGKGEINSAMFAELVMSTVNPIAVLQSLMNNALAYTTIGNNIRGVNSNFMQFNTSGLRALEEGCRMIRHGLADAVVVGGAAGPVEPFQMTEAWQMGRTSLRHADADSHVEVRPWDSERSGCVLSEGAAFVVLESEAHAVRRRAEILGWLAGCASRGSAHFGPVEDAARGSASETVELAEGELNTASHSLNGSVRHALSMAEATGADIGIIFGEGNGELVRDEAEARLISSVRRANAITAPVWTSRGKLGESIEAGSMIDLVLLLESWRRGVKLPPVSGVRSPTEAARAMGVAEMAVDPGTRCAVFVAGPWYGGSAAAIVAHPHFRAQ